LNSKKSFLFYFFVSEIVKIFFFDFILFRLF